MLLCTKIAGAIVIVKDCILYYRDGFLTGSFLSNNNRNVFKMNVDKKARVQSFAISTQGERHDCI